MNFGGTALGSLSSTSGGTTIEQNSPIRKRAEDALMAPKEDILKKMDAKETPAGPATTDALPKDDPKADSNAVPKEDSKEVPENINVDIDFDDAGPKSDGSKINISPIQRLPNLAEAQFEKPLEDVPMPPSLMEFTQEHWNTLVMSLIAFKNHV